MILTFSDRFCPPNSKHLAEKPVRPIGLLTVSVILPSMQTADGLPPKLTTLQQAWKAVRAGSLRSCLGKVPKRLNLQGSYLQPLPKTGGEVVAIVRKTD